MDRYEYIVAWSQEDQVYVARVLELPSLAAHGKTPEVALKELRSVVSSVVEDLVDSGEPVPEPLGEQEYSGKLNLRMPQFLHRNLAIEAARQGISLNQLINLKLAKDQK